MNNKIDIRKIFSQNLKYYRIKAALTQAKLAELSNITDKYLSDLERARYDPSLGVLDSLANSLNIDTYLLLQYNEEHIKTTEN